MKSLDSKNGIVAYSYEVGILKHGERVFLPAVAANVHDRGRELVPRPESILLSNLRQVVVRLADPDCPLITRQRFRENSPIPEAMWANDLLLNQDEIIPDNYNLVVATANREISKL
ncbi:hypothetical protein ACJJTC_001323 [Scirpophaga incertulas]